MDRAEFREKMRQAAEELGDEKRNWAWNEFLAEGERLATEVTPHDAVLAGKISKLMADMSDIATYVRSKADPKAA